MDAEAIKERLSDEVGRREDLLLEISHSIHEHPELGMHEYETARFVAERLRALGVEDIRTGISETGVTGLIRGTAPGSGKVVLVRADMDALPIQEENDVEYRSQVDGVMHACGHDAHTAILLGVARVLMDRRDQYSGAVKLCFQPCEETGPGGEHRERPRHTAGKPGRGQRGVDPGEAAGEPLDQVGRTGRDEGRRVRRPTPAGHLRRLTSLSERHETPLGVSLLEGLDQQDPAGRLLAHGRIVAGSERAVEAPADS